MYEWVDFSKVPQIWAKIGSNLRKFWKKSGDFALNLAKNWTDWYMNGSLFLEKLVFAWVYFQILWRHIPTKTKIEYPPVQVSDNTPILHSSIVIFSKTLEVSKEHKYHILGNITLFTNTGMFLFQYLGLHITFTFTYMPTTSKYKIQKLACNWLNIGSFCLIASHLGPIAKFWCTVQLFWPWRPVGRRRWEQDFAGKIVE